MEDEATDYDELLKSVFHSCDKDRKGFLSSLEFQELCEQLCLEDEQPLLQKILFKEEYCQLEYAKFRDVLLLLLAGNLTEDKIDHAAESKIQLNEFHDDTFETSTPKKQKGLHFYGNDPIPYETDSFHNEKNSFSEDSNQEYLLIDFSSEIDNNCSQNYSESFPIESNFINVNPAKQKTAEPSILDMEIQKEPAEVNPDTNTIFSNFPKNTSNTRDTDETKHVFQAQEALASVWIEIVGDFGSKINVFQLQNLFESLALSSSSQDVQRLFEMLDEDHDGFVSFNDFTRKMSNYLLPNTDSLQSKNLFENKSPVSAGNDNTFIFHKSQSSSSLSPSKDIIIFESGGTAETNGNNVSSSYKTIASSLHDESTDSTSSNNKTSPQLHSLVTIEIKDNVISSETGSTPDHEEEDTMKKYHGAPAYRRKRRSSQSLRRRRGRPDILTSLPHYHPMKRQSVEDSPLFFLSDEQDRFVTNEKLREVLNHEEIEEMDQIFTDLGIGKDDSFSIEALSESFEEELKQNPVHFAICAIYKSGVCYYRTLRDHEESEKKKLESRTKHLDQIVEEQEERIEKLESEYKERVETIESRCKNKLSRFKLKLETDREQIEMKSSDDIKQLKHQIAKLRETESELENKLKEKEIKNQELERRCEKLLRDLETSQDQTVTLQTDVNKLCDLSMKFSQNHREQTSRIERMLQEYKEESKNLQDKNDELINQLNGINENWGCFFTRKKENGGNTDHSGMASFQPEHPSGPFQSPSSESELSKQTPRTYINTVSIVPVTIASRDSNQHPTTSKLSSGTSFHIRSHSSVAVDNNLRKSQNFSKLNDETS